MQGPADDYFSDEMIAELFAEPSWHHTIVHPSPRSFPAGWLTLCNLEMWGFSKTLVCYTVILAPCTCKCNQTLQKGAQARSSAFRARRWEFLSYN
jgi:hypothetical protein